MGLIGVVIASIVNIFVGSSALQFAISVIGIIVFVGLTAWDTQTIKEQYSENQARNRFRRWPCSARCRSSSTSSTSSSFF